MARRRARRRRAAQRGTAKLETEREARRSVAGTAASPSAIDEARACRSSTAMASPTTTSSATASAASSDGDGGVIAADAGMEWIIHLDTDELLHPAGTLEYSLRNLLSYIPKDVDTVVFPNYESSIEHDQVKDPFTEVSLFKRNKDHMSEDIYFSMYDESTRGNPSSFLAYGNGKSAARIQEHLSTKGAHRWDNYNKTVNEITLAEAAVLHYTYAKFSDMTSRRDRCGCQPTKDDVKRCFFLEFDRLAFIVASTASEKEMRTWYREHVVWEDRELVLKLIQKGIMTRIYTPMNIIHGLREAGVFTSAIESARKHPETQ